MQEKEERGKESSSGMGPRIEYRGRGGTNLRKLERAPGPYVTDSRSLSSAANNVGALREPREGRKQLSVWDAGWDRVK